MGVEDIVRYDKTLLSMMNGSNNIFIDQLVLLLTNEYTWIPLYISLLYLVIKNNESWGQILLILMTVGCCMLLSNGLNGGFIKPFVGRIRRFYRFFTR